MQRQDYRSGEDDVQRDHPKIRQRLVHYGKVNKIPLQSERTDADADADADAAPATSVVSPSPAPD
jgi:hypothetical protein